MCYITETLRTFSNVKPKLHCEIGHGNGLYCSNLFYRIMFHLTMAVLVSHKRDQKAWKARLTFQLFSRQNLSVVSQSMSRYFIADSSQF